MHEHAVGERHPSEADLLLHREKSLAGARHLDGHVRGSADAKLEVVHRDPLVGRVDQRAPPARIHRAHREEAVRDGAERLAQPVAVGEPGDADGASRRPGLDLRDERLDRVPERRLERRARPAAAPRSTRSRSRPRRGARAAAASTSAWRLAREEAAVDDDLADAPGSRSAAREARDHRRRERQREQRLEHLRRGGIELAGARERLGRAGRLARRPPEERLRLGLEPRLRAVARRAARSAAPPSRARCRRSPASTRAAAARARAAGTASSSSPRSQQM